MDGKFVCTGSDPAAARSQTSAGLYISFLVDTIRARMNEMEKVSENLKDGKSVFS